MKSFRILLIMLPVHFLCAGMICAQSWDFVKESSGIKIYTRNEPNSALKSFRGEVTFAGDFNKVNLIIGNARNIEWWDKDIIDVKVLAFEENKMIRYYFVYDLPWPFSNRDLELEARISNDSLTGDRIISAKSIFNIVPEKTGVVRIKKYWQKWTVHSLGKGYVHVTLEGFADPGGNIPSWLYNSVITDTPMRVLKAMRERVLSDKPANI